MYIMVIILAASLFKMYAFSTILCLSSILGYIVDISININEVNTTMSDGMVRWFIILLAIIVGIVIEVVVYKKRIFYHKIK